MLGEVATRRMVVLKRRGVSHGVIASKLGVTESGIRKALQRIGYQAPTPVQVEWRSAAPEVAAATEARRPEAPVAEVEAHDIAESSMQPRVECAAPSTTRTDGCVPGESEGAPPTPTDAVRDAGAAASEPAVAGQADAMTEGDPWDRTADRVCARMGLLSEASPQFGDGKDVAGLGVAAGATGAAGHGRSGHRGQGVRALWRRLRRRAKRVRVPVADGALARQARRAPAAPQPADVGASLGTGSRAGGQDAAAQGRAACPAGQKRGVPARARAATGGGASGGDGLPGRRRPCPGLQRPGQAPQGARDADASVDATHGGSLGERPGWRAALGVDRDADRFAGQGDDGDGPGSAAAVGRSHRDHRLRSWRVEPQALRDADRRAGIRHPHLSEGAHPPRFARRASAGGKATSTGAQSSTCWRSAR